jgi:hypothetical protein
MVETVIMLMAVMVVHGVLLVLREQTPTSVLVALLALLESMQREILSLLGIPRGLGWAALHNGEIKLIQSQSVFWLPDL